MSGIEYRYDTRTRERDLQAQDFSRQIAELRSEVAKLQVAIARLERR